MLRFLARRLVTFIPTILGIILITYMIAYLIPTDPVRSWVGGKFLDPEAIERVRKRYRFDAPWYEQFTFLAYTLFTGQLDDPVRHVKVIHELSFRFPVTFELALFGFIFTAIIGIPLGIISALRKDSIVDFFVRFFAFFGSSMPSFVLYYFLILALFSIAKTTYLAGVPRPSSSCYAYISSLPSSIPIVGHLMSYVGQIPLFGSMMCGEWNIAWETVKRFYLPGLALGLLNGGFIARIVRNSLLDALNSDYVLFAKARGLPKRQVWNHAFKNALVPLVTVMGLQFGGLLSGAVIAETVFNIPGMGRYMYDSITRLNFPAIIAGTFLFAIIYVTVNLIVDILYAIIDPRIRY